MRQLRVRSQSFFHRDPSLLLKGIMPSLTKKGQPLFFGIKKLHGYLYGREFDIKSDHKPLRHLFDSQCPIPQLASARLQRWALILNYNICYKPGKDNGNANFLSCLPLLDASKHSPLPEDVVLLMENLQSTPVSAQQIHHWTDKDLILSKVHTRRSSELST